MLQDQQKDQEHSKHDGNGVGNGNGNGIGAAGGINVIAKPNVTHKPKPNDRTDKKKEHKDASKENRKGHLNDAHIGLGHPGPEEGEEDEERLKPVCDIKSKDATSAMMRARTNKCKNEIMKAQCLQQEGKLYPKSLPKYCPLQGEYTSN